MRRELQFMGRMTAGMTHEINNVLAVIRETAGLAQDLTASHDSEGRFKHQERVLRCLEEIQRQITRGSAVIQALNRFAHSVDHDRQAMAAQEILDVTMALNDRFARQHLVTLEAVPAPTSPVIEADLFLVIEILSRLIDHAVAELDGGGKVYLSFAPAETGRAKAVRVWPEPSPVTQTAPDKDPAADLGAEMARWGLSISLPADPAAAGWLLCW